MTSKLHHITVCNKGTFWGKTDYPVSPKDIDNLFDYLRENEIKTIGLFIHGGLVGEASGWNAVQNMNKEVFGLLGIHGIGMIWKSGFGDMLKENLLRIHKTKLFKKLLVIVLKKAGAKLGFGSLGKGVQEMTEDEILTELTKGEPFAELEQASKSPQALGTDVDYELLERTLHAEFQRELLLQPEIIQWYEDPEENFWMKSETPEQQQEAIAKGIPWLTIAKGLVKITWRVIKRHRQGTDHRLHATTVEEIMRELALADFAEFIWGGMKTKAEAMWSDHKGTAENEMFVGTYFLDKLEEYSQEKKLTVDLIAHSAGAVVTCYMLRRIEKRGLNVRFRNIAFLAPACTFGLFQKELMPRTELFERFRMYTMYDRYELKDKLLNDFPVNVYPASLLYFVSGVCEPKVDMSILGMERYYSGTEPYNDADLKVVSDFVLEAEKDRIVWSVTGADAPPGMQSESTDHGFFDNDPATLKSLCNLLT